MYDVTFWYVDDDNEKSLSNSVNFGFLLSGRFVK